MYMKLKKGFCVSCYIFIDIQIQRHCELLYINNYFHKNSTVIWNYTEYINIFKEIHKYILLHNHTDNHNRFH
jgi:hypothetical protein